MASALSRLEDELFLLLRRHDSLEPDLSVLDVQLELEVAQCPAVLLGDQALIDVVRDPLVFRFAGHGDRGKHGGDGRDQPCIDVTSHESPPEIIVDRSVRFLRRTAGRPSWPRATSVYRPAYRKLS
ncbi:MAG TPA: hypothetical protein DCQ98_02405, partial [Planctomycetaceae bacterium]|nr:hypothetical protein [Planctomycetaceae bacterium]